MFGIHCPTGFLANLGYVLLGLSVSIVSPPMVVFALLGLGELLEEGYLRITELLMTARYGTVLYGVRSMHRNTETGAAGAGFRGDPPPCYYSNNKSVQTKYSTVLYVHAVTGITHDMITVLEAQNPLTFKTWSDCSDG